MKSSRKKQFAGRRREVVVEVLAQALLELVLRGETATNGAEESSGPSDRHAPR